MTDQVIERFRATCLALPEVEEKETWDRPTFRVRNKIFAMARDEEIPSFVCKAPHGVQDVLVGSDPHRFFIPSYVGHKGWIGMRLNNDPNWTEVEALVRRSYSRTAPKALLKLLEETSSS